MGGEYSLKEQSQELLSQLIWSAILPRLEVEAVSLIQMTTFFKPTFRPTLVLF